MFCKNPFSRLEIKADGRCYVCCEGWLPTSIGNILEENLLSIWKSPAAEAIRKSILDESFRHCKACPYLPDGGGTVTNETVKERSSERIEVLKLDYDQTCNLSCQSCRVVHSSEFVDVPKVTQIHEAMLKSGILNITNQVYVTGAGDPFASPLYWKFLKEFHLQDLSKNPNIRIFLHTNGILFDPAHWNNLHETTKNRITDVGISIDAGTAETYKINRKASWNKLINNLIFINYLQRSGFNIKLGLFFTVQANNFRELPTFLNLADKQKVSWISITALRNWGTYTDADYLSRAVHIPGHQYYNEFRKVLELPELHRPGIILDSFNPEYTNQDVISNPNALIPEKRLKDKR